MDLRYSRQKQGGWTLRMHPDYTLPEFTELCCCEDKPGRPEFEKIRDSRNTRLFRFKWNGKVFYHKEFKSPSRLHQFRKRLRLFHQIRLAAALQRRGIGCPAVLCAGRKGMRIFCVYEGVAADGNAPGVYRRIADGSETRLSEEQFLRRFGRFTGEMHRKRIAHGDYQWGNVLVQFSGNEPRFVLIDNDRTSFLTGRVYWYRMRNLIQMMRAADYVPVQSWEWFWAGYAEGCPRAGRWKPLIERFVRKRVAERRQASAARRAARQRSNP